MIYCRKKELKEDDVFSRWSRKRGVDLKWIKAEGMGEEKLGLGKNEISDVLKVSLSQSILKVYIDGRSYSTQRAIRYISPTSMEYLIQHSLLHV